LYKVHIAERLVALTMTSHWRTDGTSIDTLQFSSDHSSTNSQDHRYRKYWTHCRRYDPSPEYSCFLFQPTSRFHVHRF